MTPTKERIEELLEITNQEVSLIGRLFNYSDWDHLTVGDVITEEELFWIDDNFEMVVTLKDKR